MWPTLLYGLWHQVNLLDQTELIPVVGASTDRWLSFTHVQAHKSLVGSQSLQPDPPPAWKSVPSGYNERDIKPPPQMPTQCLPQASSTKTFQTCTLPFSFLLSWVILHPHHPQTIHCYQPPLHYCMVLFVTHQQKHSPMQAVKTDNPIMVV